MNITHSGTTSSDSFKFKRKQAYGMITKAMNAIDNVKTVQHARKVLLDFNSLATEMKMKTTFKSLLLNGVKYIPSKFEEDIIDTFLLGSRDRKTAKAEAIKFILEHNERLAEIHDLFIVETVR